MQGRSEGELISHDHFYNSTGLWLHFWCQTKEKDGLHIIWKKINFWMHLTCKSRLQQTEQCKLLEKGVHMKALIFDIKDFDFCRTSGLVGQQVQGKVPAISDALIHSAIFCWLPASFRSEMMQLWSLSVHKDIETEGLILKSSVIGPQWVQTITK